MKETNKNTVIFNDGTEVYPYNGFISINEQLEVGEGNGGDFVHAYFNGDVYEPMIQTYEPCEMIPLTPQHRAELADYMIELWTKFKEVK